MTTKSNISLSIDSIIERNKPIIIMLSIVLFLLVLIMINNIIRRRRVSDIQESNNTDAIDALSYHIKKYNDYARKLEAAFKNASSYSNATMVTPTAWLGTKTEWVFEVFRDMKTREDILQLILAYGKRQTNWWFSGAMTLMQAIDDELNDNEILKLNKIIKQNGIDFKFYRLNK